MNKRQLSSKDLLPCLLCADAPCAKACPKGMKVDSILRSLRFSNQIGALLRIEEGACASCFAPCEEACILPHEVKIRDILAACSIHKEKAKGIKPASLATDLCGIPLENPFLLSSSVVASNLEMVRRAFQAGWAGAAFKTISFIDIHEASPRFTAMKSQDGSFSAFKNIEQLSDHSVEDNLSIFRELKREFPTKFLLVSIMGRNNEEWAYLAKASQDAGADALELNFSCPNMTEEHSGSDIGQVPELVERYTRACVDAVTIPVIAKLTPNVMTMSPAAEAAKRGGAKGIAAINTIKSIAEVNIVQTLAEHRKIPKFTVGGLSGPAVKPIALRFISELSGNKNLKGMHISAMGGIVNYEDAFMFLSLGADSLQITTAVMEFGYRIIEDLTEGLSLFLGSLGATSLQQARGIAVDRVVDVTEMERDTVIYPKFVRERCVGCGRCYISCMDGGHQALSFVDRKPMLDPRKCVGCHLCVLVCPNKAIVSSDVAVKKKAA